MIHREGWSSTAAARSIGQTISDDPSIRGSELEQTYFYPTQNRVSTRIYVGPPFFACNFVETRYNALEQ